jgi:hypothetical protein
VGAADDSPPAPLPEDAFWHHYRQDQPGDEYVLAFRALGKEADQASGLPATRSHRVRRHTSDTGNGCPSTTAGAP